MLEGFLFEVQDGVLTVHAKGRFFQLKTTKRRRRIRDVRPGPVRKLWIAMGQLIL